MLSKFILIKRNSIGIQHNHTNDVFQGPVEDINKVIEKMEEDFESEADGDNDELNIVTLFCFTIFHNMFVAGVTFIITVQT